MARREETIVISPKAESGDNRRRYGRLVCELVKCGLGDVLDASAAGLRVRCRRHPVIDVGEIVLLTIDVPGAPFQARVKVVWIKRRMFRRTELGVQFVDITPTVRDSLNQLARIAAVNTTFHTTLRREAV